MVNANYCKTSFVHFPCEIECSYDDDNEVEEEKYNQVFFLTKVFW